MGWIKVAGKTLEYAGQLAQSNGFEEWAESQATGLIEKLAKEKGFSLFGKERAVKKDLLRELRDAGDSELLAAAINEEARQFRACPGGIAQAIESNEYIADGHTYVIPKFLVSKLSRNAAEQALGQSAQLKQFRYGELREYFFSQLIDDLHTSFESFKFDPKKPVATGDEGWLIVGQNTEFRWDDQEPSGFFCVFQARNRRKFSRKHRSQIAKQIDDLKVKLSRFNEHEIAEQTQIWNDAFSISIDNQAESASRKRKIRSQGTVEISTNRYNMDRVELYGVGEFSN